MPEDDEGDDARTLLLKLFMAHSMSQGMSRDEARQIAEQKLRLRMPFRDPNRMPLLDDLESRQCLDDADERDDEGPATT